MKIEKRFNYLIRQAKKAIFLSTKEKEAIRSSLISFMKDNPVRSEQFGYEYYKAISLSVGYVTRVIKLITERPALKYASIISVFAVLVCGGISFASQSSLPGDILYPVKVGVNEKVLSSMLFSDESKAKYNIHLVQLRLEEGEKMASEKKLDNKTSTEIKLLLNKQIENANNYSNDIKYKNIRLSAEINSELEASLNAHAKILDNLADRENNGITKNIKNILSDVESRTEEIKKTRQDSEDELSLKSLNYLKDSADSKLKEAEDKVAKAGDFISDEKENISSSSYNDAEANLNVAKDIILQGQQKFQSSDYSQAFSLFQKAIRISQETQINVAASIKLKIKLPKIKINSVNEDEDGFDSQNNEKQIKKYNK